MHATTPGWSGTGNDPVFGKVQVPAASAALLELRLGEAGRDAVGFAIHVPHYLAQAEFGERGPRPQRVGDISGLDLPQRARRHGRAQPGRDRPARWRRPRRSRPSRALERQYDTFLEGRQQRNLLAADRSDLPTADEIGAEFEDFLGPCRRRVA